ncbi:MAG TPA: hypothetical protein VIT38_06870 [Allosphingosinicella sp.]
MKTMTITGIAILLCIAAPAAAQRGGGGGTGPVAMPRAEIQRIDPGRTISPARDIEIRRGDATGGVTGTRIPHRIDPHRPPNHHARRRWNAANPPPHDHARRRWNAANPSDPSRRREDR